MSFYWHSSPSSLLGNDGVMEPFTKLHFTSHCSPIYTKLLLPPSLPYHDFIINKTRITSRPLIHVFKSTNIMQLNIWGCVCERVRSHLENSHELNFELATCLQMMTMEHSKIKIGAMNVMKCKIYLDYNCM